MNRPDMMWHLPTENEQSLVNDLRKIFGEETVRFNLYEDKIRIVGVEDSAFIFDITLPRKR